MSENDDLLALTISEIFPLLIRGDICAAGLVDASQKRIHQLNPTLNAVLSLRQAASSEAQAIDKFLEGQTRTAPLAGIPLAHKDMFYRKGETSTFGAHEAFWKTGVTTSTVKTKLDDSLALDVATLHMAEFASGPTGENIHHGRCLNPWSIEHLSGGSSSGSAVAVASRMVYGSIGSDTGGSIRVPSALCGVTGLKPTTGRVSRYGAMARAWTQDSIGPIARSAEDCGLLLEAITGPDPRDPLSALNAPNLTLQMSPDRVIHIGVLDALMAEADSDVLRCVSNAIKDLSSKNFQIKSANWADIENVQALAELTHKAESTALHDHSVRKSPDKYSEAIRRRFEEGTMISAVRYLQAHSMRSLMTEQFVRDVMKSCDVIAIPTVACVAPAALTLTRGIDGNEQLLGRLTRFTRPFNYLGLPALTIPCGFGLGSLPVGLQLIGRPFDEAMLLYVGRFYQTITDWHKHKPNPPSVACGQNHGSSA